MDILTFLDTINRYAEGYLLLARGYHNLHISGFADWKGILRMPDVGQKEVEKAISGQIDDQNLAESYYLLRSHLEELEEVDRQIIEWLAHYVGLSSVTEKKDKVRLDRKLRHIITHGPDGHPQGPIWAQSPEYQEIIEQSEKILGLITEDHLKISQRIQLLTQSTGIGR